MPACYKLVLFTKIMGFKNQILFSCNISKHRFCIRNQFNEWFNDFDLLRFGRTFHQDRTEYKVGFIGIQLVLMINKK